MLSFDADYDRLDVALFEMAVEIGDWDRFTGRTIGSFIGLTSFRALLGQLAGWFWSLAVLEQVFPS